MSWPGGGCPATVVQAMKGGVDRGEQDERCGDDGGARVTPGPRAHWAEVPGRTDPGAANRHREAFPLCRSSNIGLTIATTSCGALPTCPGRVQPATQFLRERLRQSDRNLTRSPVTKVPVPKRPSTKALPVQLPVRP